MAPIRVLIVDDAVVVRRMVSDALSADPALEVVGTAANGKIGLAKIPQVNPDVITLDIEMPEMNGLETLVEVRKLYPRLPVIMFSTATKQGATATFDALAYGANDYVTKPSNVGSVTAAQQALKDQLIPRIKGLCGKSQRIDVTAARPTVPSRSNPQLRVTPAKPSVIEAVTIGVSTGGPNALAELLPAIPANFPVPILIVQHMPPMFTKSLAERLDSRCEIEICEATNGETLRPNKAYVAPGDYHMTLKRGPNSMTLLLNQEPPQNSCRPSVDVTFRSAIDTFGANTLGVILTGMGQDGLRGCEEIHDAGGQILAQDEASSVVWGMPGLVVKAGLADDVLPLSQIADEIVRRVNKGR